MRYSSTIQYIHFLLVVQCNYVYIHANPHVCYCVLLQIIHILYGIIKKVYELFIRESK